MVCPGVWSVQVCGLSRCVVCPGAWSVQVCGLSRCVVCPGVWSTGVWSVQVCGLSRCVVCPRAWSVQVLADVHCTTVDHLFGQPSRRMVSKRLIHLWKRNTMTKEIGETDSEKAVPCWTVPRLGGQYMSTTPLDHCHCCPPQGQHPTSLSLCFVV